MSIAMATRCCSKSNKWGRPATQERRFVSSVSSNRERQGLAMGEPDAASRFPTRRTILQRLGAMAQAAIATPLSAAVSEPLAPIPLPAQVPVKEDIATVAGTRLSYWDTGGNGPAIVLLHPATGTSRIWSYQQPVFSKAGYRVIAYSKRGYGASDPVPKDNPDRKSTRLNSSHIPLSRMPS